ncbi:MAG: hypothetical protein LBJ77_03760 [Holosporales bacterium]|nr:hypothetical protein [Holosporales bacterium]
MKILNKFTTKNVGKPGSTRRWELCLGVVMLLINCSHSSQVVSVTVSLSSLTESSEIPTSRGWVYGRAWAEAGNFGPLRIPSVHDFAEGFWVPSGFVWPGDLNLEGVTGYYPGQLTVHLIVNFTVKTGVAFFCDIVEDMDFREWMNEAVKGYWSFVMSNPLARAGAIECPLSNLNAAWTTLISVSPDDFPGDISAEIDEENLVKVSDYILLQDAQRKLLAAELGDRDVEVLELKALLQKHSTILKWLGCFAGGVSLLSVLQLLGKKFTQNTSFWKIKGL